MKSKVKFLLTLTILTAFQLRDSKNELKDFKITIESTDDGISMKSLGGSSWHDLSFSMKKYNPQAVDEYAMPEL